MSRLATSLLAVALLALAPLTAHAAAHQHAQHQDHGAHSQGPSDFVDGEVRRVDKDAGKITLRHGPLPNLDMPAMTMVFQVSDRAMLDKVNVGDKVRFETQKIGGQFTVTQIERTP